MIGSGLGLGAGFLFKTGPEANTSVIGLGGLRSDNGSRAAAAIVRLASPDNRWQIKAFAGKADVIYELYTGLGAVPVRQESRLARINAAFGFTSELSAGIVLRYLETVLSPEGGLQPPSLQPGTRLEIGTAGFSFDWDRRDDSDYPTEGTRMAAVATRSRTLGSLGRSYERGIATFDGYRPFGARSSLAVRGTVCAASSGTPFFDQCSIGATDNMRGFNSTKHLGLRMVSLQAEYRQRFSQRWGGVVFAGTGRTGNRFADLAQDGSRSAAGAGVRYRVSKKFPVDFSIDISRSNERETQLYIYVGQRF
ncbi:BamA/TamA family outer membrane protein [Leisingera sp.]|uniref:BamA/TamA family outer membrane protein n=1 Tax=Leisingera sp. TaxID=1879318 RepID=UPI002B27126B|nr:BamA/TamA family outer membrane protein [Leisingera sp.]